MNQKNSCFVIFVFLLQIQLFLQTKDDSEYEEDFSLEDEEEDLTDEKDFENYSDEDEERGAMNKQKCERQSYCTVKLFSSETFLNYCCRNVNVD